MNNFRRGVDIRPARPKIVPLWFHVPSVKLTVRPLQNDGWNTIVFFWGPAYFHGLCLWVSRRVFPTSHQSPWGFETCRLNPPRNEDGSTVVRRPVDRSVTWSDQIGTWEIDMLLFHAVFLQSSFYTFMICQFILLMEEIRLTTCDV